MKWFPLTIPALRKYKLEDQDFKKSLSHTASSRITWTISNPVSKERKEEREKRNTNLLNDSTR